MAGEGRQELNRQLGQLEDQMPDRLARFIEWLRHPSSRWVRIPLAIICIGAGFLGFLPILGFWMLPLGVLLLAQDIPFLRKPTARALERVEDTWGELKQKWRERKRGH